MLLSDDDRVYSLYGGDALAQNPELL